VGPDRLSFYVVENLIILFEMTLSALMFFSGSFRAFAGFLDGLLATVVPPKRIVESKSADELTDHLKPRPKKIAANTSTGDRQLQSWNSWFGLYHSAKLPTGKEQVRCRKKRDLGGKKNTAKQGLMLRRPRRG
jgi:hypothetical protein